MKNCGQRGDASFNELRSDERMAVKVRSLLLQDRATRNETPSAQERRRFVEELGSEPDRLGLPDLQALQFSAIEDPDSFVREYATSGLIRAFETGHGEAADALARVLLEARLPEATDPMNRARAADAFRRHASQLGESALEALSTAARADPDEAVREHALKALGAAAVSGQLRPLETLTAAALTDPYDGSRKAALDALARAVLTGRRGALAALSEVLRRRNRSPGLAPADWHLSEHALFEALERELETSLRRGSEAASA
jgi:HEAT repeat protein